MEGRPYAVKFRDDEVTAAAASASTLDAAAQPFEPDVEH